MAAAEIWSSIWNKTTGWHYNYTCIDITWIKPKHGNDVNDPPVIESILAQEQSKLSPIIVQSGTETITMEPHIEHITVMPDPNDPRPRMRIVVAWYSNQIQGGTHSYYYEMTDQEIESYRRYVAQVETQIEFETIDPAKDTKYGFGHHSGPIKEAMIRRGQSPPDRIIIDATKPINFNRGIGDITITSDNIV